MERRLWEGPCELQLQWGGLSGPCPRRASAGRCAVDPVVMCDEVAWQVSRPLYGELNASAKVCAGGVIWLFAATRRRPP